MLPVLGIALSTVALGVGWLLSSLSARAAREAERIGELSRSADAVRGAVDESLEELRRREDSRPFYLYNPLYSPPDVLALNDPIAPSPLARDPEDRRVVGYFQIEPDGTVRTPYSAEPNGRDTERASRVVDLLRSAPYAPIRSLANPEVQQTAHEAEEPEALSFNLRQWLGGRSSSSSQSAGSDWLSDRRQRRLAKRRATPSTPRDSSSSDSGSTSSDPLAPQGPLTVSLNPWNQEVYNDLQLAQSGSEEANLRVQNRGRAVPQTRRNTVDWQEMQANQMRALDNQETHTQAPRRPERPLGRRRSSHGSEPPAPVESPSERPPHAHEVEVDYTPMAWRVSDEEMVLHRLVSHQGASVVQGMILDRRQIVGDWIPSLVGRHTLSGAPPRVISRGDEASCEVRRSASAILEDVELCYAAIGSGGAPGAQIRDDLHLQLAALAGLVLIVMLAGVTMHRATRRAEELSAQKSSFVSAVSHELRTPLTTIRMHAEMLREGLVPDPRQERFHGQIVQEAVRLSRLVENVLELSRIEEGRRVVDLREADLAAQVRAIVEEQRAFVSAKGFELRGPAEERTVPARFDDQAMSQIVVNLIDNAVKYGGGDGPQTIEVDIERLAGLAVLRVLDRGPGVPAKEREKVFERFHRVSTSAGGSPNPTPGTGIGLALVRELARAQGGDALVRKRDGGGCEVRVTLPALGFSPQ